MLACDNIYPTAPEELYPLLKEQLQNLVAGVPYPIANLANASALLCQAMADINWVGFYLRRDGKLVLGPFQGKTACIEIPLGRGVCGTAAAKDETQLVVDVHAFPGHIACDSASNAEIVLPLIVHGTLVGVMDIDSPKLGRFTQEDAGGLAALCKVLEEQVDWEDGLL